MNKNGFTLIEVLAVVIILSIILVIAVPNVNRIVKSSKENAAKLSATSYVKAIENANINKRLSSGYYDDGEYSVGDIGVEIDGTLPTEGEFTLAKGVVTSGTFCVDGFEIAYDDGEYTTEGECGAIESVSFSEDSWKTIVASVKSGTYSYKVGDTKTVDLGTYGTHTLRVANTTTPAECSTEGFSQSACGFVLEFADIITTHNMNPKGTYNGVAYASGWNTDGWPASSMYSFVNTDIYNALPKTLRKAIIDTTVVSGHGSSNSANFISTDKLYLLDSKEIYGAKYTYAYDSAKDYERQLDYYTSIGVTPSNYSGAVKKYEGSEAGWWVRSANINQNSSFFAVFNYGVYCSYNNISAYIERGVSPAFRIG